MNILISSTRRAGVLAFVVVVAGCTTTGTLPGSPSTARSMTRTAIRAALHLSPTTSWMAGGTKNENLLYIADVGSETVDVFTYPQGKRVGTLTGFDEPNGECSDKAGDVFVTNSYGLDILEYAHGATKPKATLTDGNYYPDACAVDPTTGDLVVTNYGANGTLALYKHAKGKPVVIYPGRILYQVYYCGYDDKGDLFIDGFDATNANVQLVEMLRNNGGTVAITLNVDAGWPGGVQWDGKYLAMGDQYANKFEKSQKDLNVVYQIKIDGGKGTVVRTAELNGAGDVSQFWIDGATVIGPDAINEDVGYWKYPAGGNATKSITGFYEPVGATVSEAPR